MNKKKTLSGIIPIVPTPFTEKEEIDEEALGNLIEFAITSGLEGACLPAYASEFYKLTDKEKLQVVKIAVEASSGRLQIVAQANHPSLKAAIELAKANIDSGSDIVALAVPRIFSLPDDSLFDYLEGFLNAIPETPVLLQDVNPLGTTINGKFAAKLNTSCPNFKYLKLEEPLCAPKFKEIIKESHGKINLFEGWGGLYMMELIPIGIAGVMPGLAISDILQKIFMLRKDGKNEAAFDLFEKVMPQIFFALQNMELFHYAEKELLLQRGIINNATVRKAAYKPDASMVNYIKELNQRILQLVNK